MRERLSAIMSAVLLSTAACTNEPRAPEMAPAARPAGAKGVPAGGAADEFVIPEGWSRVYSPRGEFRAALPSRPMVTERGLAIEGGWATLLSHEVTLKNGSGDLSVIVTKYPKGTMSGKSAEQVLEDAGNKVLAQHSLTLVTEKPVKVDGPEGGDKRSFPGRDLEAIQKSEGRRASIRLILVDDWVYQLMFIHKDEKTEPFEQLLSTFALRSFPRADNSCCGGGPAD